MDRSTMLKVWDDSWTEGSGVAPWSRAVADLSPEQAAWRPGAGRHSIWQNANHVSIWREYVIGKVGGRGGLTREEVYARNFEEPAVVTGEEWRDAVERLHRSHEGMRGVIESGAVQMVHVVGHYGHDCYHLGQIMQLRAMQGLGPIE
jgi:uncharacterized damage-inducible protein DinB